MNVFIPFSRSSSKSALRMNCAHRSPRVRVLGIVAGLFLAAIAVAAPAVHAGKAQTADTTQKSSSPSPGNPQNGQLVFKREGCDRCHGSQGEGLAATDPNGRVTQIASTTLALPSFIQLIRQPKGRMPPFGSNQVSDVELSNVYAFLHSSASPVEHEIPVGTSGKKGQLLFTKYGCSECHLSQGQGSRATGARLAPTQIPLSGFISYVRQPTGEMPPYTQKTVSNEELADMYAFLHSVPQPSPWKTIPLLNQ